ncbi:hypothetical protein EDB85DRAFT_1895688 [Lactarius pseudohatsudake]|nr:hypothetical protein EDB85DRAFT_1895688 [Lactarius pseudohatsudake]
MVLRVRSKKKREHDTTNKVGHPEEAMTGPVSIPNQRNGSQQAQHGIPIEGEGDRLFMERAEGLLGVVQDGYIIFDGNEVAYLYKCGCVIVVQLVTVLPSTVPRSPTKTPNTAVRRTRADKYAEEEGQVMRLVAENAQAPEAESPDYHYYPGSAQKPQEYWQ